MKKRIRKQRISFWNLFRVDYSGNLVLLQKTRIMGMQCDAGVIIGKGVSFNGVDFTLFIGRDLQIKKEKDVNIVLGIY